MKRSLYRVCQSVAWPASSSPAVSSTLGKILIQEQPKALTSNQVGSFIPFSTSNKHYHNAALKRHAPGIYLSTPNLDFADGLEAQEVKQAVSRLEQCSWSCWPTSATASADKDGQLSDTITGSVLSLLRKLAIGLNVSVSRDVERVFETAEFLEGASHAVSTVCQLHGARDFLALRTMVSERVLSCMKEAHDGLATQGLRVSTVDPEVTSVRLDNCTKWSSEGIAAFDNWRLRKRMASVSPEWLVARVEVSVKLHVALVDLLGEPAGQHDVTKSGTWLFARGPLPAGVTDELDTPWFLLAWL